MKRIAPLIAVLAVLSVISGYLLSKASFVGKVGINFFYQEYKFLKVWWQGGLVVFAVLMFMVLVHTLVTKSIVAGKAKIIHLVGLVVAIIGLYFTYNDFRHSLSHRMLGERFHLGAYLFWIGWMIICLFFLAQRNVVKQENLMMVE